MVSIDNARQLSITVGGVPVVLLSATDFPIRSDIETEQVFGCPLRPGKYATQSLFVEDLRTALATADDVNVVENGTTITLSITGKKCSLVGDPAARVAFPNQHISSANKWLGITDDNAAVDAFSFGPVTLPRDVNTLYLHSDTLAGFRDTEGPMPGQRATIAKIAIGNTPAGGFHAGSLYRPHMYTTLPRTDISSIAFSLRDSRGVVQDLKGSNLSFCITFDTSHLLS